MCQNKRDLKAIFIKLFDEIYGVKYMLAVSCHAVTEPTRVLNQWHIQKQTAPERIVLNEPNFGYEHAVIAILVDVGVRVK